jgi:two-component system, NarL family, response regulator DegU
MPETTSKIRIYIVDDHPLFRQGLRQVLQNDARFDLVGEAEDGQVALDAIVALQPDLAVLDLNLPSLSGLDVATRVRDAGAKTRLVVLTMLKDEPAFNRAMNVGVLGYLLKESAVTEIVHCLISVAANIPYVSPALSAFLLKRHDKTTALAAHIPNVGDLTVAERRILKRIAEKKSTKEIALELGLSPRTIETHRANIGTKLGLRGSNSILQFAIEHRDALSHLQ